MTDRFAAAATARCASVEAARRVVQPAGLLGVGAGAQVRPHERVAVQAVARVQRRREPLPKSVDREPGEPAHVGAELQRAASRVPQLIGLGHQVEFPEAAENVDGGLGGRVEAALGAPLVQQAGPA